MDYNELDQALKHYEGDPLALIPALQKAQDICGYLPPEVITRIAAKLNISPANVQGVATFYAQFRLKPAGKHLVMLCQGTACHVNNSAAIEEAIISHLSAPGAPYREGDTTPDGLFTLKNVACLGCCSLSPAMMINGETYGSLTPDKAVAVLKEIASASN